MTARLAGCRASNADNGRSGLMVRVEEAGVVKFGRNSAIRNPSVGSPNSSARNPVIRLGVPTGGVAVPSRSVGRKPPKPTGLARKLLMKTTPLAVGSPASIFERLKAKKLVPRNAVLAKLKSFVVM